MSFFSCVQTVAVQDSVVELLSIYHSESKVRNHWVEFVWNTRKGVVGVSQRITDDANASLLQSHLLSCVSFARDRESRIHHMQVRLLFAKRVELRRPLHKVFCV